MTLMTIKTNSIKLLKKPSVSNKKLRLRLVEFFDEAAQAIHSLIKGEK
jgi:hypothetical protein